jgi:two-component system, OmpR family, phosphate regulon sensor histidine kinase PhoR
VARDFVEIIFNHSQRLSQLVRDLLDLSKLDSEECPFELNPMELLPIMSKVIGLSQKQFSQKQITLNYEPPAALPHVWAHDTHMEQVITNLLDNAIKYTPEGGTISVRVQVINDKVQVDVQDTGIGIEPKHTRRVFERFYRVDKARSRDMGGTGLGLSIVKHIIQVHGGEVWVNSTPGEGSTFSFWLQPSSSQDVETSDS